MQESEEFKDDFIIAIVEKGVRKIPNSDFEDEVMLKVKAAYDYKKEVSAKLVLSLRCFVGALFLGVLLAIALLLKKMNFSYDLSNIGIAVLFVITAVGILNIDNYKRLIRNYTR